ncbi:MAG: hypothetical protein Q4B87_02715 [Candidatus Saccharibacteria bacterium]|nr:hypothetical protein [Candidatus Saccharibacteria bacterium]
MDEFEPGCGPGGMGCIYCTKQCPNCYKEVFDQDIIYGNSKEYCRYCRAEVEEEERQALEEELDDDEEDNEDDEYDDFAREKSGQRIKKQEERLKDAKAKLRKSNIEFLKATAKANGEPIPENLDDLSDEELNDKVKPLLEKYMEDINDKIKRGMA